MRAHGDDCVLAHSFGQPWMHSWVDWLALGCLIVPQPTILNP